MTTSIDHSQNIQTQNIQNLCEVIKDIDSAMLTTVDEDGSLHSRPMATSGQMKSDGTLWFFTNASSHKVFEIERRQQVNVSFASSELQRYASISGTAELLPDRQKMAELWQPELQNWFPQGLDEPDLILLKVNINKADYWDSRFCFSPQTIKV